MAQTFAYVATVEHAGDLAEQFEVFIGGCFGNQQDEQQIDRGTVDGIEVHGGVESKQGTDRRSTAGQPAMGDRDAVAEAGGTELFAGDQALEYILAIELGHFASNQVGYLFEYTFLAASRHVHQGTAGGQDIF